MTKRSLSQIFVEGQPNRSIVAYVRDEPKSFAEFKADVAFNAVRIAGRKCRRAALATASGYWGAVGLFALVAAKASVILPQNVLPGALAAIAEDWDIVVTDAIAACAAELSLRPAPAGAASIVAELDPATAVVFYSSGSTGAPKRIVKRFEHLEREAEAIEALLGAHAPGDARLLSTVPHQHAYGLAFRVLWGLFSGRPFVAETCVDWREAIAALSPGTVLITAPAHLNRIAGLEPAPLHRRPALVLSAGAPLSVASARDAIEFLGVPVREIFGSTETGAIAWRFHVDGEPSWLPLPGITISRTNEGLLHAAGLHVPNAEPGQGQSLADGVDFSSDGGFNVTGRNDRIVKIEANRVSLAEVEGALCGIAEVADAAVAVLSNSTKRLAAAVVLTGAGVVLLQHRQHHGQRIAASC